MARVGLDAIALKPKEHSLSDARELAVDTLCLDYEGREHLPDEATLDRLARDHDLLVTTPVRADGFDPLGDDSLVDSVPERAGRILVAGHPAYLTDEEKRRAIAPRLSAAREEAPDAWVGTEGVERVAMALGGTQYDLLSRGTANSVRAVRTTGFEGEIAVYAPVVVSDAEDEILDAAGPYTARRGVVRRALPDGAPDDSTATGRAREVLSAAVRDFALVGSQDEVRAQTDALREAGVDTVVGYPARGLAEFL